MLGRHVMIDGFFTPKGKTMGVLKNYLKITRKKLFVVMKGFFLYLKQYYKMDK